jgi:hypothetical protein
MSGRHLITSRALRRCAAFAASAASLAVAAVAPTTAQAGTYEMHQCADPFGVHAPIVAEWSASKGDIDSNCPVGGPLHVRFTNTFSLRNGETGGLLLDVPASAPATRISGFRTAITTNPTSGSNSHLAGRLGTDLLLFLPLPAVVSPTATYAGAPARTMSLLMECNNTAAFSECSYEHGRPFNLTRLTLLLQESAAPTATFSGTLAGTGPKAGTHTLVVTGSDPDSGVRDVELRIDGQRIDSASFAASCSPVRWQVCPANPSHSFTVDTTALADGSHAVSAVVTDHAGNTRTENWGDIVVRNSRVGGKDPIDDFDGDGQPNRDDADDDNDGVLDVTDPDPFNASIPGADNGGSAPGGTTTVIIERTSTPAKDNTKPAEAAKPSETVATLPAGPAAASTGTASNGGGASDRAVMTLFGSRAKQTRTVGYGRRVAMIGRVTDEFGRPISGAVLTVEEQAFVPKVGPLRGASWTPVVPAEPLVTGKDGSFRYIVPAGHSRTVRVGYKARVADTFVASTQELTVLVVGKATLRTSRAALRNGQRVAFYGRLLGGRVPRTGVTVVLQARTPRGWVTFSTTRARRDGRFTGGYRFHATTGTRVYAFRAAVKADSSYPFLPSTSNTTKVTVRG